MDYIESLAKQAQQLTVYDIKSYYNQAKNAVLNVSEMEAKVREATNDDPWGASSTLMQQIADGTHNFQNFNEIMPCIYARFMEKEAREWRQIYKALTLLEFLVKNGSERVVDDARAHVSTIKMLRSFHYVDDKGKDQGINVRNRSQEIAALLVDVEKIRQERRKARANKNKYQGQGNDAAGGLSFTTGGGGRYGGFGSESVGGVSASGGGSGGFDDYPGRAARSSRDRDSQHREQTRERERDARLPAQEGEYDEYEGADDFEAGPPRRRSPADVGGSARGGSKPQPPPKARKEEKKKEVDLFDFGDDEPVSAAPAGGLSGPGVNILGGDDDFDDFQTAPPTASAPAPAASARPANSNLFDLLKSTPAAAPTSVQALSQPPAYAQNSGNGNGFGMMAPAPARSNHPTSTPTPSAPAAKPKTGASTFDDLWATSLSTVSSTAGAGAGAGGKKSLNEMDQQKTVDKLWGMGVGGGAGGNSGQFGSGGGGAKSGGGGGDLDDLLL